MKVTETDTQFVFIFRPEELFDLTTVEMPPAEAREGRILAVRRDTGDRDWLGFVYGKGFGKGYATTMAQRIADRFKGDDRVALNKMKLHA